MPRKKCQNRWDHSTTGHRKYEIFPRVSLMRLHSDFYLSQALAGHGNFGDHQERLRNKLNCPYAVPVSTIQHCLHVCPRLSTMRKTYFPRDYHIRIRRDLCLDPYFRKGEIAIVSDLFHWTLCRSLTDGQRIDAHARVPFLEGARHYIDCSRSSNALRLLRVLWMHARLCLSLY